MKTRALIQQFKVTKYRRNLEQNIIIKLIGIDLQEQIIPVSSISLNMHHYQWQFSNKHKHSLVCFLFLVVKIQTKDRLESFQVYTFSCKKVFKGINTFNIWHFHTGEAIDDIKKSLWLAIEVRRRRVEGSPCPHLASNTLPVIWC